MSYPLWCQYKLTLFNHNVYKAVYFITVANMKPMLFP